MSRRTKAERFGPSGFLVVDKPPGMTSHDVVDAARRALGTRRVGHLGTLDPQATGVLPLAIRDATKLVPYLVAGTKRYRGTIRLGIETDTLDGDGRILREHTGPLPSEADVRAALGKFAGEIEQIPPMYSAVKKGGVALHRLARRGEEVEREPRRVRIDRIELIRYTAPVLELEVDCSPGTYVRSLAADLGTALGCGAHLASLQRLASGPFELAGAVPFSALEAAREAGPAEVEARLRPSASVLGFPIVALSADGVRRVLHGAEIAAPPGTPSAELYAGVDDAGGLVAILAPRPGRMLAPSRVIRSADPPRG